MKSINPTLLKSSRRTHRVRSRLSSSTDRPRLSVNISNKHIVAQIIDDSLGKTLAHATTVGQSKLSGTMKEKATWVGSEIAKKAKAAKVQSVVFDRGPRLYHGRVKALAIAARENGLEF